MDTGQPTAIGIDGQTPARRNTAILYETSALSFRAKPIILKEQDRVDGEGIVKLHNVNISWLYTRLSKGARTTFGGRSGGHILQLGNKAMPCR